MIEISKMAAAVQPSATLAAGAKARKLKADGLTAPCFLVGPTTIVLPAFTPNAAGLPIGSAGMPGNWSSTTAHHGIPSCRWPT